MLNCTNPYTGTDLVWGATWLLVFFLYIHIFWFYLMEYFFLHILCVLEEF